MANESNDPMMSDFQQWQLGIALLFLVAVVGSLAATGLGALGVPYGEGIGLVGGALATFLGVSYWYYGR